MSTEQLSGMLELPIEKILDEKNFRVKTIDLTKNALNKFDAMFKVVNWIKKNAMGSWEQRAKVKEEQERRAKEEEERKAKAKKVKKEKEKVPENPPPARRNRGLFGFGGGAPTPAAPVVPPPAAVQPRRMITPTPPVQAPVRTPVAAAKADAKSEIDEDDDPELQQALLASMTK